MQQNDQIVLMSESDEQVLGVMEKYQAHVEGACHRAFSVVMMNSQGLMLLQRRAHGKYHSGGLWSNACCSHPRLDEMSDLKKAVHRRLSQELGVTDHVALRECGCVRYRLDVAPGNLIEHEMTTVFSCVYDGPFALNPDEVSETRWISLHDFTCEYKQNPERFSAWLRFIVSQVIHFSEE